MKVNELMSRDIKEIGPQSSLQEAAQRMREFDVGSLPVVENRKLLGVITDRDITVRSTAAGVSPQDARVGDVMTPNLIFCYEDEDVEVAAELMEERQVRRLPVLNRDNQLIGILALADLALRQQNEHLCSEVLHEVSQPSQPHM